MLSTPGIPGENVVAVLLLSPLSSTLQASDIGRESSKLTHRVRGDHCIYQSSSRTSIVSSVVVCVDEVRLGHFGWHTVPGVSATGFVLC